MAKSKWGHNDIDNLCLACYKCNVYRGNLDIDIFLDWYRHTHAKDENWNQIQTSIKIRWPKRWYHGNIIKW